MKFNNCGVLAFSFRTVGASDVSQVAFDVATGGVKSGGQVNFTFYAFSLVFHLVTDDRCTRYN